MTLKEVCQILGKSESTIKDSFYRTKENLAKKGIILEKEGYGKKTNYTITYEENYSLINGINEIGNKYGQLLVLERDIPAINSTAAQWKCQCDCGNIITITGYELRSGKRTCCPECSHKNSIKKKTKNILGQKFGHLTVIEYIGSDPRDRTGAMWKCKCDCGKETIANSGDLQYGHRTSCGCIKLQNLIKYNTKIFKDLTGQRFGHLTVLKLSDKNNEIQNSTIWTCQCDCGNIIDIRREHLVSGNTTSCGCLKKSHGEEKIENILKNNNISFIAEKCFSNCQFPDTKGYARFDFYVNEQYLIEYDGEQHYKELGDWFSTKRLEYTQMHDEFKNQWCKDNNIPLIRIPYWHLEKLCLEDLLLETSQFII